MLHFFSWLDDIPIARRPNFIRGDCGFGTNAVMLACEDREINYLFKLKQTKNLKRLIAQKMVDNGWCNAGQGWQGIEESLQLQGWSKSRRVIIMRRNIKKDIGVISRSALPQQLHAVGKQISHAGQKIIKVSSGHGKFGSVQSSLVKLSAFFKTLRPCAEQLGMAERMRRVLELAFKNFLELPLKDSPKILPSM